MNKIRCKHKIPIPNLTQPNPITKIHNDPRENVFHQNQPKALIPGMQTKLDDHHHLEFANVFSPSRKP